MAYPEFKLEHGKGQIWIDPAPIQLMGDFYLLDGYIYESRVSQIQLKGFVVINSYRYESSWFLLGSSRVLRFRSVRRAGTPYAAFREMGEAFYPLMLHYENQLRRAALAYWGPDFWERANARS